MVGRSGGAIVIPSVERIAPGVQVTSAAKLVKKGSGLLCSSNSKVVG
jgi:hypothetical protein